MSTTANLIGLFLIIASYLGMVAVKRKEQLFLSYSTFSLFLVLFYILVPAILQSVTGLSLVNASASVISYTTSYAVIFVAIHFSVVFIWNMLYKNYSCQIPKSSNRLSVTIVFMVIAPLIIYVSFVVVLNISDIINAYGHRSLQSSINNLLETKYKIKPLFVVVVMYVSFACLLARRLVYTFCLAPFFVLDLLLAGRLYMFSSLMTVVVLAFFLKRNVRIIPVGIVVLLIASFSVLRAVLATGEFQVGYFFQMLGEFVNTWEVVNLIASSQQSIEVYDSFLYSFLRVFPSPYYTTFIGDYYSYTNISSSANPLDYGLAGSIIAEPLSFKSNIMLFLFPIIFSIFSCAVDMLRYGNSYSSKVLFVLFMIYSLPIFRFSFLEFAMYPIYNLIWLGFIVLLFDAVIQCRGVGFVGKR